MKESWKKSLAKVKNKLHLGIFSANIIICIYKANRMPW